MRWVVLLMMVGCGSSSGGGEPSIDAPNLGTLVFEDRFDNFPTIWAGTPAGPGRQSDTVGNPAPAMQFISATGETMEALIPVAYAGEGLVATVDVWPFFEIDGEMLFRFHVGTQPSIGFIVLRTKRTNGMVTSAVHLDFDEVNVVPIPNAVGFRTLRVRVDQTGMTLDVDGTVALHDPAMTSVTAPSVLLMLAGVGRLADSGSRAGVHYVDNVRLYRSP